MIDMTTRQPYHYVRFRRTPLDFKEAEVSFRLEGFNVEKHDTPTKSETELSMKKFFGTDWNRDHLIVKADTLEAFLTQSVGTLLQRKSSPFTQRDLRLREIVLSSYDETRAGTLSPYVQREPEFDVEENGSR
jgi:hypothetical protein